MTGTWTLALKAAGPKTEVSLAEKSVCRKFMTRAAFYLGRDANLRRMLGILKRP